MLIDDLPAGIQPDTIVADFPKKGGVALQGQSFRQVTASLLANFVGGTVSVITTNPVTGAEVVRPAKLLRGDPRPLVQLEGRIERTIPGRIAPSGLPSEALLRPSLELDFEAPRTGPQTYRPSYLTAGPGWSADPALHLDPSER